GLLLGLPQHFLGDVPLENSLAVFVAQHGSPSRAIAARKVFASTPAHFGRLAVRNRAPTTCGLALAIVVCESGRGRTFSLWRVPHCERARSAFAGSFSSTSDKPRTSITRSMVRKHGLRSLEGPAIFVK